MKQKSKMTPRFIIGLVVCLLLGILGFLAGYYDINWKIINWKIASILLGIGAFYIGLCAGINSLPLKKWERFLLLGLAIILCVGFSILIIILFANSGGTHSKSTITSFQNVHSIVFITLTVLFVGQLFLSFFWKTAHRWGLIVFYFLILTITAVVGHIVEHGRDRDTQIRTNSMSGYGTITSDFDQEKKPHYNYTTGERR